MVIITNLYPLPWQQNRATFNKQQFELLKDDYDVSILVPIAFPDWFKHMKQITNNTNVRYAPYFYLPKLGRRFYSVSMFLSLLLHSGFWLKKQNIQIIFASWAFPDAVAASWLSKLFRTKFFFKVHGSDINLHGKIPARAKQIVKASIHADGILCVSKALSQEMVSLGINESKISVIYNGVDHSKFGAKIYPAPVNSYVLFVGNLKHDKGVLELVRGFAKISHQHPELHLIFAGDGAEKNNIISCAEKFNISAKVSLLGSVEHNALPELISCAKILALPSYNEGVPNVVLEAMACGTTILATKVGGIPEIVDESICGTLITPKCEDAVANGLTHILAQEWSEDKIKQHSQKFTWETNKQQLLGLLSKN
ncbi:glycosyltransferase [Colwellia sp. Bg11-12]|nr:glycosyltransferase [Colwellia sp. Bg11-12]